jgi:hypothetical protein
VIPATVDVADAPLDAEEDVTPVPETEEDASAIFWPVDATTPVPLTAPAEPGTPPPGSTTRSLSNHPSGVSSGSNHDASPGSKRPRLLMAYASRLIVPKDPASTVVAVAVSERHRSASVPALGPFSIRADRRAM